MFKSFENLLRARCGGVLATKTTKTAISFEACRAGGKFSQGKDLRSNKRPQVYGQLLFFVVLMSEPVLQAAQDHEGRGAVEERDFMAALVFEDAHGGDVTPRGDF